jgi:two-component system, OmpR family, response regulator AdeR
MRQKRRVLVVWEDAAAAARIATVLATDGYQVRVETDSFAGLLLADAWSPDLIMLNWEQPLVMGAVFRAALRSGGELMPPIVALTAADHAAEVDATGAAVLVKPPSEGQVRQCAHELAARAAGGALHSGVAATPPRHSNRTAIATR